MDILCCLIGSVTRFCTAGSCWSCPFQGQVTFRSSEVAESQEREIHEARNAVSHAYRKDCVSGLKDCGNGSESVEKTAGARRKNSSAAIGHE